jgi:hypothetical protein
MSCRTKREPLRRFQGVEHDQQGQADRVGDQGLVLRVAAGGRADDRVGHAHVERLLPPGRAGSQQVERDPPDDRGQPGTQVVDLVAVRLDGWPLRAGSAAATPPARRRRPR